jgi:tRNA(Arg) A34 adenosine deaminase TadA
MDHERWMALAIEQARAGIAAGQSPFGSVVVRADQVLGSGHNEVWQRTDPTAHAEVVAIGRAARNARSIDLSGSTIYTTCEPCPMCAAAIHWARADAVVWGATIADAATAGFNELALPAREVYRHRQSRLRIVEGVLRDRCSGLFAEWKEAGGRAY